MIKILRNLDRKSWFTLILITVLTVGQVYLNLQIPAYMSAVTRLLQEPGSLVTDIYSFGFKMIITAIGSIVLAIIAGFFIARTAASLIRNIRFALYDRIADFSMKDINQFSTASLITRTTNDTNHVRIAYSMGLQIILSSPVMAFLAIRQIMGKSYEFGLATAIGVGALTLVFIVSLIYVMPRFARMQSLTDEINRVSRENLTGLRVIRAYNAENYQQEKFETVNDNLFYNQIQIYRTFAILRPMTLIAAQVLILFIYIIGAHLINSAGMDQALTIFSDMIVFSQYAMQIIFAFIMLVIIAIIMPRAQVSANRLNEVLDTKSSIIEGKLTEGKPGIYGELEFKNVSFKYPDAEDCIVEDISFKVTRGKTLAFIGSTGSGKTTLANLAMRFLDVTKGEVLVDGVNVKDYKLEALYNKLGYVSQRSMLYRGDIESNINFGKNSRKTIEEADIYKAIDIAQGTDFVRSETDEIKAPVAQLGSNFSGGQKQRLSIARAIFKDPEILIFDDSFSALDYQTDRKLRNRLKEETKDVTKIIIAQRVGTIIDADEIIVLDKGRIVCKGSHEELLRTSKVYLEIAKSQLSEEELKL